MTALGSVERRAFARASMAGAASLVFTLLLMLLFPASMGPLPESMRTPILAFELARSTAEVETMFGPPGSAERAAWLVAMNRGNWADFVYMLLYGSYLVLFSRALAGLSARPSPLATRFAPLPALIDVLENVQLLSISSSLGGDYRAALARLHWFTWGKWLLIALVLLLWIPSLWRLSDSHGHKSARLAALSAGLTAVVTLLACFVRGLAAELMALGSAITLLLTLGLSVRLARSPSRADTRALAE
jgi:hypothetical protein